MTPSKKSITIASVAIAGAAMLLALRFPLRATPGPQAMPARPPTAGGGDDSPGSIANGVAAGDRSSVLEPADAVDPAAQGAASEPLEAEASLAQASRALETVVTASLYDTLDPGAILDAALQLGSLQVDSRPYSEPDPSGCTVYPLLGAPEGTQAELWVGRSSKPEVGNVLSLRLELEASIPDCVLANCAREKAIAQVQMQLDREGKPLNLSILTDVPPSGANRELGIPLDQGTITQGVLYYVETDDQAGGRARAHGLRDGAPGSWKADSLVVAGLWPCPEKVDALCGLLKDKYETIRR